MAASRTAIGASINDKTQLQHAPQQQQQQAPHGTKRPAESSLENEQRLSKRFDLLNLDAQNGQRLYIPVPPSNLQTNLPPKNPTIQPQRPPSPSSCDSMQIEETPHRIYIHDLAAELSDIESDSETPIFLPDIEKHLSKIPKHVLLGPEPRATEHNQVVLYRVPSSLTVPVERDGVRKAVLEARERLRVKERERDGGVSDIQGKEGEVEGEDVDAMEIDDEL